MNVLEHIQFNDAAMSWTLHKSIIELSFLKTLTIQRVCQLTWTLQNPSFKTHALQQLQGAEMTWAWHKSSFGSTFLNALTIQWMQQLTWTLRKPMLRNWQCSKIHTVQGHVGDLNVSQVKLWIGILENTHNPKGVPTKGSTSWFGHYTTQVSNECPWNTSNTRVQRWLGCFTSQALD